MTKHISNKDRRMAEELVDMVEEDTSLHSYEKETIINFSKVYDCASVYTEEGGLMRRLLCHPHFEVKSFRDAEGKQVAPSDFEEGSITGVKGAIPREALTVQTPL